MNKYPEFMLFLHEITDSTVRTHATEADSTENREFT